MSTLPPGIAIVGAGRMGQGLALALRAARHAPWLLAREDHPVAEELSVLPRPQWGPVVREAGLVLLAVPDDAIATVAGELAASLRPGTVVLHVSGRLGADALSAVRPAGASPGSFHPLQTIADPRRAPERLRGAAVALEGSAEAVAAGHALANALGLRPVEIDAAGKAAYHAGASLVANGTVALVAMAERLAAEAGVPPERARGLYQPLLRGAVDNLEALPPVEALTGPVRRGDAGTVAAHLAALDGDARTLYLLLAREALALARAGGLDDERARAVARALEGAAGGADA